jgi:hypothetical protein
VGGIGKPSLEPLLVALEPPELVALEPPELPADMAYNAMVMPSRAA